MERDNKALEGGGARPSSSGASVHQPVMPAEVLAGLLGDGAATEGLIIDGTVGGGGHARLILEAAPKVELLGLDQDPQILELAEKNLAPQIAAGRARLLHGRLTELGEILEREELPRPVGLLLDLGASSLQLDRPERGFSFQADGPLDMRMDPRRVRTAAQIVNTWDEADLADLIFYEGDERRARPIARAIVEGRRRATFQRTAALADLISRVLGGGGRIHPATRTFQALRRGVNEEGEELSAGLAAAQKWLAPAGRLAVISFHSGEDRVVKRFLAEAERDGSFENLGKKPQRPSRTEERENRRSRSARLRLAVRQQPPVQGDGELETTPGNVPGSEVS
ncbi:MAG: 16S rRNA (cytosine(1402)-N(4))-methyltransferase RsmH [Planctomycetota bacterium]|nr:16S rRNA (cytosine(1402)-N(4))-methyltransferase RsmH [Planctomycetota bacterium]